MGESCLCGPCSPSADPAAPVRHHPPAHQVYDGPRRYIGRYSTRSPQVADWNSIAVTPRLDQRRPAKLPSKNVGY
ncbi:MAG: hypothetical protein ACLRWQ_11625 [Flavonifractor plautii]